MECWLKEIKKSIQLPSTFDIPIQYVCVVYMLFASRFFFRSYYTYQNGYPCQSKWNQMLSSMSIYIVANNDWFDSVLVICFFTCFVTIRYTSILYIVRFSTDSQLNECVSITHSLICVTIEIDTKKKKQNIKSAMFGTFLNDLQNWKCFSFRVSYFSFLSFTFDYIKLYQTISGHFFCYIMHGNMLVCIWC